MSNWCYNFNLYEKGWPNHINNESTEFDIDKKMKLHSKFAIDDIGGNYTNISDEQSNARYHQKSSVPNSSYNRNGYFSNTTNTNFMNRTDYDRHDHKMIDKSENEMTNYDYTQLKESNNKTHQTPLNHLYFEYITRLEGRVYVCVNRGCDRKFLSYTGVLEHFQSGCYGEVGRKYSCPYFYCNKRYKQAKGLHYHLSNFHNEQKND